MTTTEIDQATEPAGPTESPTNPSSVARSRRSGRPGRSRRRLAIAAAVVAGLATAYFVLPKVIGAATPHLYHGTVLQQSEPAPSMEALRLASGEPVDLAGYRGDVVMVYFGYTGCPDVCPTTLSMASRAIDRLSPAEQARLHLLMVSVDPERDAAEPLQQYVEFFHPSFVGAHGATEATLEVSSRYGVFFESGEPDERGEYFVDHTATLMAIDPDGVLRLVWSPTVTDSEVAADLEELLR